MQSVAYLKSSLEAGLGFIEGNGQGLSIRPAIFGLDAASYCGVTGLRNVMSFQQG